MKKTTSRMDLIQSPIIPIVAELIQKYPGTISLGQGIVYYQPPEKAFEQIPQFLANPENHKYKAVNGITPLLDVIQEKIKTENGIDINTQNRLFVTAGSNMGFLNAILAITNPGDEIILQTPYYFNHEMAIAMASCQVVLVATDENYQLRPEAIKKAITDKTRAVVTISPNNPSGAVYSEKVLREVNAICRTYQIYHISDEAYEYFTYNHQTHFSPGAIDASDEYTISLFSLSKAYGFASWRIGYMVIPEHLIGAVKKIQDTILICPPVISQYVAFEAMKLGKNYLQENFKAIANVREMVLNELEEVRNFCTIPQADGAFYFLLKVDTKLGAMELVEKLISEYGVAVIPGTTFGMENGCYLRVAYGALQKETAAEGIGRLVKGLKMIVKG